MTQEFEGNNDDLLILLFAWLVFALIHEIIWQTRCVDHVRQRLVHSGKLT